MSYASRSLAESGYKCFSEIDGFCLGCPPGETGSMTFAEQITCTCSGGEPCSIFKDGEPSTEAAFAESMMG